MAHEKNYRINEFDGYSQTFAQGGINAAFLLNGGASIAVLALLPALKEMGLMAPAGHALFVWALGISGAALVWILAFASTRFVSRALQANFEEELQLKISDYTLYFAIFLWFASVTLFVIGVAKLACEFSALA